MVSRYGHVKQDGICLLPPQFRMMTPQRTDGYPNQQQPYVPQAPNQGGNQAPNLRSLPQSVPPNQAPTPPNSDIKVQSLPQQPPLASQVTYNTPQLRQTQTYYRTPPPPPQQPRMQNRQPQQQPMFPQPQLMMSPMILNVQPQHQQIYMQQPSRFIPPPHVQYFHQQMPQYSFSPNPQTTSNYIGYYPNQVRGTGGPPTQAAAAPPNPAPAPMSNMQIPIPHHVPQTKQKQRRPNALAIIDPNTGEDRLNEVYEQQESMSGESSARQTPQPAPPNPHNKEVQAAFAKQVAQAISNDENSNVNNMDLLRGGGGGGGSISQTSGGSSSSGGGGGVGGGLHHHHHHESVPANHIIDQTVYVTPQAVQNSNRDLDNVVQSSTLQVQAKEFVSSNTAKEITPVVSANCDSEEVILSNKQQKDRESPIKGRKQREQQQIVKEPIINKDTSDRQSSIQVKDDIKQQNKEIISNTGSSVHVVSATTNTQPTTLTTNKDSNKECVDNKRNHKNKDNKVDSKVPNVETSDGSASVTASITVQSNLNAQDSNAKSKNSSQKNVNQNKSSTTTTTTPSSSTPIQPPQQQQQHQANNNQKQQQQHNIVPQPQPAKPNNKSHKKNEINIKGANKEGTDMDLFQDNATVTEVNANLQQQKQQQTTTTSSNNDGTNIIQASINVPTTNDILNANSITNNNNKNQLDNIIDNKKTENINETTTINKNTTSSTTTTTASAATTNVVEPSKLKTSVDVTDIVKDFPKVNKPLPQRQQQQQQQQGENQDETDRISSINNEKLVQVKNEVNAKGNINSENAIEAIKLNRPNLPYTEDQWSPSNPTGNKVYQREFLLALREFPASKKRPEHYNIPDSVTADERPRYNDGRASMGGRTDFTTPPFLYGGKSSSQRGTVTKRNSQSGKLNSKSAKRETVKISLSLRAEDVKLNEAENAWRPARLNQGPDMTEDDRKTADLYNKVRGILNKLTPQKYEILVGQVKNLQIDTVERLQGVIDLVFRKAVDEPNFSVAYAAMCKELALLQVPTANSTNEKKEYVNFRKLILTRCQVEFEKQSVDESERNTKVKEIEECTDPERKKDLIFDLEEYDRKLRMKSVGNIRFIGELFKQQMLTVNIMMRCLDNLLSNKDEESLECLCKLLTTIGKELEAKNVNLSHHFQTMKEIVDKKHGKVSSRVRFMLQDVIDLRLSNWVPRRQDLNPKTIDQIQKEAENEQLNSQSLNAGPITPRKDDRNMSSNSQNSEKRRNKVVTDNEGWTSSSSSRNRSTFSVKSDKLRNDVPPADAVLGSSNIYKNWSKGSNMKVPPASMPIGNTNMYAALENINQDQEKRMGGQQATNRSTSKESYIPKGSIERYNPTYDGRSSRSGSQNRIIDNNASVQNAPSLNINQQQQPQQQQQNIPQSTTISSQSSNKPIPVNVTQQNVQEFDEEKFHRRVKTCVEEFCTECCTAEDFFADVSAVVPSGYLPKLVTESHMIILERSSSGRIKIGDLFAQLIKLGKLSLDDYLIGLEETFALAEELIIDIPMIWDYLVNIILKLICEDVLPLKRLHAVCGSLIENGHIKKLLSCLFKAIILENGPRYLSNIWQVSGLQLTDFMPNTEVNDFIKNNQLEFLNGGEYTVGQTQITYEQIQNKLIDLLKSEVSMDDIINWITVNVGDRVKEEKFIRVLATAVFEDSIHNKRLVHDRLSKNHILLQRFVDNDAKYELQCLLALQAFINRLEHPQGLLLTICDKLYNDTTFSQESFNAWQHCKDPAEQEGKGVAIKQLTSFFTQLNEVDEDEDYEDGDGSSSE